MNDPAPEVNRKAKDGAELNGDGEHLPVAVFQVHTQKGFGDAQMSGRTDGKKLGQSLDDAEEEGQRVVVQTQTSMMTGRMNGRFAVCLRM